MFYTGLKRFETADVDHFTSDSGILFRRKINRIWRKLLILATRRTVHVEQFPALNEKEPYLFVANHSFDEDAISVLQSIDRNAYMLHGTTHQMEHNPAFYAMWVNGMIYVNRLDDKSRKDALSKMRRILKAGSSVILFPEGGYNNTENQLIMPLFASPYLLSKELGIKIVPVISFHDTEADEVFVRAGEPMDLSAYDKQEALAVLRDEMATILFSIMEIHTSPVRRNELGADARMDWLEVRRNVYGCYKWYADVWDEELTCYPGHLVTTPKQSREYVDHIQPNHRNATILADTLVRRAEDRKYDFARYLRNHLELCPCRHHEK